MMPSVLKRPKRLPRRFRRRVTPAMKTFAARRHKRRTVGKTERLRRWWRKASVSLQGATGWVRRWSVVMAGVVAAALIGVVLFSPLLHVREIRVVRGQGRVDVAAIQHALLPLFGRHLLLLSSADVEARVRAAVPDLESVQISKQYPARLFLRVRVKPLVARLMLDEPKPLGGTPLTPPATATGAAAIPTVASGSMAPQLVEKKDYLTENGLLVSTTSAESGTSLPLIRVTDWGVRPSPSQRLMPEDFLQRMRDAERILTDEFGQAVTARTIYLRAQEFHLQAGKLSLWFDMQSSLEDQLTRYRLFLKTVGVGGAARYVDLRLTGRVVYR